VEAAVGIRRLRDGLTRYLGRVRRGERLIITDRGRPIAVLLPYGRSRARSRAERLGALLASGHVSPAERPFLRRPPLVRGQGRRPSELIAEGRR
jgi:prevent-host-death family protein